jgi:uncharacterized protein YdaU (DUF1376 family)
MAQGKPEWFKMDPARFLQDQLVDSMTTLELGITTRFLCRQWVDGFIPNDLGKLARLGRVTSSEMEAAWPTLSEFFPALDEGRRANRFMWVEREFVKDSLKNLEDKGRAAAKKRWDAERESRASDGSPMPNPMGNPLPNMDAPVGDPMQDKTRQDRTRDKDIPPKGGAGGGEAGTPLRVPKRKSAPKASQEAPGRLPQAVIDAVNQIARLCPKKDPQDRSIRVDVAKLADRIKGLFQDHPWLTVDVLVMSWRDYLASDPAWIKAPQYFFGQKASQKEGAHWEEHAAVVMHKQADAREKA